MRWLNPRNWFARRRLRKRALRMLPVAVQGLQETLLNHAARITALERFIASNDQRGNRLRREFERAAEELTRRVAEQQQKQKSPPAEAGNGKAEP